MALDKNQQPIQPGDIVTARFIVREVTSGEGIGNVRAESYDTSDSQHITHAVLYSSQVEKYNGPDSTESGN